MNKKNNNLLKNVFIKIKNAIVKYYKPFFKFLFILFVLAMAWYGFIFLVGHPPIDYTPALIMVWLSVFIIFLALFPKILDRIKRFKLKDFEIELQESVKKSTAEEDFISMDEFDDYVFSQKGDFRNLTQILKEAKRNPDKQILLTVNLRDGDYISIPMLFVYIFFMDLIGNPVNILFITSKKPIRHFSDITQKSILGIIPGKKAIKIFYDHFPWLMKIFEFGRFPDITLGKSFHRDYMKKFRKESFFRNCYQFLREDRFDESEFLTEEDVISWFGKDLDTRTVNLDDIELNNQKIKDAIEQGDDFLIIIKNSSFRSVVAVCKVTRNISSKILTNIIK